jgi:hypothetical protein
VLKALDCDLDELRSSMDVFADALQTLYKLDAETLETEHLRQEKKSNRVEASNTNLLSLSL